jgi:vacuolar-type H+-ATPase subunit H
VLPAACGGVIHRHLSIEVTVKEVIARVLETEKQARQTAEEARVQAKTLVVKAGEEARTLSVSVREKALADGRRTVAAAEAEAQAQREKELARSGQEGKTLWKDRETEIKTSVEALFRIVTGAENP